MSSTIAKLTPPNIQKHLFILKGKERVITFESSKIWDDTKIIENIYEKNKFVHRGFYGNM